MTDDPRMTHLDFAIITIILIFMLEVLALYKGMDGYCFNAAIGGITFTVGVVFGPKILKR